MDADAVASWRKVLRATRFVPVTDGELDEGSDELHDPASPDWYAPGKSAAHISGCILVLYTGVSGKVANRRVIIIGQQRERHEIFRCHDSIFSLLSAVWGLGANHPQSTRLSNLSTHPEQLT